MRRVLAALALGVVLLHGAAAHAQAAMYGLIGKMRAVPGKRDALVELLTAGTGAMPGCLSYVIALDPADPNAIWITEVWDSEASHKASLTLPAVRDAITKAKPLIASFDTHIVTTPIGGVGLSRAPSPASGR